MWLRRSKNKSQERQVIAEAEDLLGGRVVGLHDLSRRTPVWSVMNILAHSNRTELARIRDTARTVHPGSWAAALAYLATELMSVAQGESTLVGVQRQALIPVELQLLGHEIPAPTTPAELVILVLGALDERQMYPDC